MPKAQFVILAQDPDNRGNMPPIGPRSEIVRDLSRYNTAPEKDGGDILYGPGIIIQLPPGQDPIVQMLLSVTEEEIAWQSIMRIAKAMNWKLLDPASGRELVPPSESEAVV